MAKFNSKKEKTYPTEVNEMGSKAYKLDPKEELVATVLTSFLQKKYYESEKSVIERLQTASSKVDPEFLAKLAIYARRDAHMRSTTHLLAGEVAKRVSGKEWGSRFFNKVAMRPDDMSEITGYWINIVRDGADAMKLPNAMKKGFKKKLESMDSYSFDKYKMNTRSISMIDLINLYHPDPEVNSNQIVKVKAKDFTDALLTSKRFGAKTRAKQIGRRGYVNISIIEALIYGIKFERVGGSKILEQTMSEAGKGFKTAKEKQEAKAEAIKEVLVDNTKGMPYFNLLRSLVKILDNTPEDVPEACRQLTIRNKILNAKILPFRYLSAFQEIEKAIGTSTRTRSSSIQFENNDVTQAQAKRMNRTTLGKMILDALETAMNISCENIVKLQGNTAILIDHSGSVRGDSGGSSVISKFSNVRHAYIGNLFGSMLMQTQDNVYVGMFGDRLIRYDDIDREKGILHNAEDMFQKGAACGGATENGIFKFLYDAIENKVRVDNLIVFSDMVIGTGRVWEVSSSRTYGGFQKLFKEFKRINPHCNVVSVDINNSGGKSVFHKSLGVTQVAGWSEKIFDQLRTATNGYKDLIKEIEAIKL
jgi:hypothetical protein